MVYEQVPNVRVCTARWENTGVKVEISMFLLGGNEVCLCCPGLYRFDTNRIG